MGDHTESFQVDFDPDTVSYDELLETFWTSHDPTHHPWKVQYASLVLAADESQLEAARNSAERIGDTLGRPLETRIEMLDRFWLAEEYHQKYHLRQDRALSAEFRAMFGGDETAFRESTAAARVNGYVAGDGSKVQLSREIDLLGLTDAGRARLAETVARLGDGIGCPTG
jgi:hypothetical protein